MSDLTRISWSCEACGEPITNARPGVVGIPFRHLSGNVNPLRWRIQHNACIDPDWDVYGFDTADLSEPATALRITTHLMSKSWFTRSTWRGILLHLTGDRWAA